MSDELEPLAPSLRALLDAGAEGPPAPDRIKDRLLHRVEATVQAAPSTSGTSGARVSAPVIPIARKAQRGGRGEETWGSADSDYVASAVGYTPRSHSRLVSMLAGVFVLGAAAGAALVYGAMRSDRASLVEGPPAARTVSEPVQAPVPASETAPSPSASHDPLLPPAPVHVEPEPHGSTPAAPSPPREDSLAAERALVETARAALARADANAALAILQRHARQFPNGVLAEEREALAIQALAKTGDVAAAKTRGERFLQRYPRSLFAPVVDEAMRGN